MTTADRATRGLLPTWRTPASLRRPVREAAHHRSRKDRPLTTTIGPAIGAQVRPAGRARLAALLRGAADDAAWVRPAHVGVGVLAAVLYLVNLTVSGFANTYYPAA